MSSVHGGGSEGIMSNGAWGGVGRQSNWALLQTGFKYLLLTPSITFFLPSLIIFRVWVGAGRGRFTAVKVSGSKEARPQKKEAGK